VKQFLLFTGEGYYPMGGWGDFKGSFDTIDEVVRKVQSCGGEWYQVVDSTKGIIIIQDAK